MNSNHSIFYILVFTMMFSCVNPEKSSKWTVVYKNDKEGKTLKGSKEELIQAIRNGASIKVGWGGKGKTHTIEHLSEPIWIAVLDEKEVITHLDPQVLSGVDWDALSANYADSALVRSEWRVVLTTKGEFDAVWINRNTNEIERHYPQKHPMTWFIKDDIYQNNVPLFENER